MNVSDFWLRDAHDGDVCQSMVHDVGVDVPAVKIASALLANFIAAQVALCADCVELLPATDSAGG